MNNKQFFKDQIASIIDAAKDSKVSAPEIKVRYGTLATAWLTITVSDLRFMKRIIERDKELEAEKNRIRTADWRARNPQRAKELQRKHDELAKQRRLQKKQNGAVK